MEKSWENFWTTGKVEDYLTYRNRLTEDDETEQKAQQDETAQQSKRRTGKSWNGLT